MHNRLHLFSISSSLYLPLSFPSCRDLGLHSSFGFFPSLSLVLAGDKTPCLGEWLCRQLCNSLPAHAAPPWRRQHIWFCTPGLPWQFADLCSLLEPPGSHCPCTWEWSVTSAAASWRMRMTDLPVHVRHSIKVVFEGFAAVQGH